MKKKLPIILLSLLLAVEVNAASLYPQGRLAAQNYSSIFDAASKGDLNAVTEFINRGVRPNAVDQYGSTVLHTAAIFGNLDLVKYLVGKGANPNAVGEYDNTVLNNAAYSGNLEIVKYLVEESHANPLAEDHDRCTILHSAARSGNLGLVRYLIEEKNANPLAADNYGNTVLHVAADSGRLEIVKYLVEQKALNPFAVHNYGDTVLDRAIMSGNQVLVDYLDDIMSNRMINLQDENSGPSVSSITGFDINEPGFGRWAIQDNATIQMAVELPDQFVLTFTGRLSDGNKNKDILVTIGSKIFHIRHTDAWKEFTQQIHVNLEGEEVKTIKVSGYSFHYANRPLGIMIKTLQISKP